MFFYSFIFSYLIKQIHWSIENNLTNIRPCCLSSSCFAYLKGSSTSISIDKGRAVLVSQGIWKKNGLFYRSIYPSNPFRSYFQKRSLDNIIRGTDPPSTSYHYCEVNVRIWPTDINQTCISQELSNIEKNIFLFFPFNFILYLCPYVIYFRPAKLSFQME